MKLEDLQTNAEVRGILPDGLVTVVSVQWFGSEALELTYKTPTGKVANELLYRDDEQRLELAEVGRPWSFDGDGALFRLVSEAQRIRLAHLFDPVLAVHTSEVEPLPHQITAVYESMLPRQPLRFLLADDPGAGKTIMAGLLIKELIARGDLQRCLVVCPGSLAEQWQDELYRRFNLPFEILTNDKLEAARTGNWFLETPLVIARLDKLSRNEDVQHKLQAPEAGWDLIVCDEAHKMSATFFGGEIKYTKRYRLGQLLSSLTRHFLLMTATPHNGKEADFQLFMALIDGDRFEGRFRDGVHAADVSDLLRRMVKEKLLKFDGTPLFPERIAYTVPYQLSAAEASLYKAVTDYVREEFNRAEALQNDRRAGTVGFALTILQRRLASSPEAIYQSLRRRRERLESQLRKLEVLQQDGRAALEFAAAPAFDPEDVEALDEAPEFEVLVAEEAVLDQATAAQSIAELRAEIDTLKRLERLALDVRRSGTDTKWRELASLLGEIFTAAGLAGQVAEADVPYGAGQIPRPASSPRQKLVLFTEHRDTLSYLHDRITTLLGRAESTVMIHGGMGREARLSVPAPTPKVSERLGLRHKTIAQWARQMIRVVRRWLPHVAITVLGDQSYSVVELGHACRRCGVRLIAPLRLDAVLHEAPPPRQPGTRGRPRRKGKRLPSLIERLRDTATPWQSLRVRWYDGRVRRLQISSGTALWYRSGQPVLPLRWVLVRPCDAQRPPRAFFSTCPGDQAGDIVACFIKRWSIETTFEESRAHLGFETQRQWSDLAIERTTPCLLSLYSLVALLAHGLYLDGRLAVRQSAWYAKEQATFSDALAAVRQHLWKIEYFSTSTPDTEWVEIPRVYLRGLMQSACYTH